MDKFSGVPPNPLARDCDDATSAILSRDGSCRRGRSSAATFKSARGNGVARASSRSRCRWRARAWIRGSRRTGKGAGQAVAQARRGRARPDGFRRSGPASRSTPAGRYTAHAPERLRAAAKRRGRPHRPAARRKAELRPLVSGRRGSPAAEGQGVLGILALSPSCAPAGLIRAGFALTAPPPAAATTPARAPDQRRPAARSPSRRRRAPGVRAAHRRHAACWGERAAVRRLSFP